MTNAKALADTAARGVAHVLMGTRRWTDRQIADVASTSTGLKVLEIGSGRQDMGHNAYSLVHAFPNAGEFVQSDFNPEFGHRVIDVTDMDVDQEFDLILCMYVLEHVFDVHAAVENMRKALKPGGRVVIAVPHLYPYHDEPIDFWRFTEYSLRRLCRDYSAVEIRRRGIRRFPKGLMVIATR
jgi:ubiquinone/menaquinone biosynthesis C-methylase UbiE